MSERIIPLSAGMTVTALLYYLSSTSPSAVQLLGACMVVSVLVAMGTNAATSVWGAGKGIAGKKDLESNSEAASVENENENDDDFVKTEKHEAAVAETEEATTKAVEVASDLITALKGAAEEAAKQLSRSDELESSENVRSGVQRSHSDPTDVVVERVVSASAIVESDGPMQIKLTKKQRQKQRKREKREQEERERIEDEKRRKRDEDELVQRERERVEAEEKERVRRAEQSARDKRARDWAREQMRLQAEEEQARAEEADRKQKRHAEAQLRQQQSERLVAEAAARATQVEAPMSMQSSLMGRASGPSEADVRSWSCERVCVWAASVFALWQPTYLAALLAKLKDEDANGDDLMELNTAQEVLDVGLVDKTYVSSIV
jgi:hypothetical protein